MIEGQAEKDLPIEMGIIIGEHTESGNGSEKGLQGNHQVVKELTEDPLGSPLLETRKETGKKNVREADRCPQRGHNIYKATTGI